MQVISEVAMVLLWCALVLISAGLIIADQNASSCITPNAEDGFCVSIHDCPMIKSAITSTREKSTVQFAKESRCGKNERGHMICCAEETSFLYEKTANDVIPNICSVANLRDDRDCQFCGRLNQNFFHFSDEIDSPLDDYPWMALLNYNNTNGQDVGSKCTGSLISKRYVITAASCIRGEETKSLKLTSVRLGEFNLSTIKDCKTVKKEDVDEESEVCNEPTIDVDVQSVLVHPHYDSVVGSYDVALIRLTRDVNFTDFISPVCLSATTFRDVSWTNTLTSTGWGINPAENEPQTMEKQDLKMDVFNKSLCTEKLNRSLPSDEQTCFVHSKEKATSLNGDIGGPLMQIFIEPGDAYIVYYQVGIISQRAQLLPFNAPGIFTSISRRVLSWIYKNIRP